MDIHSVSSTGLIELTFVSEGSLRISVVAGWVLNSGREVG